MEGWVVCDVYDPKDFASANLYKSLANLFRLCWLAFFCCCYCCCGQARIYNERFCVSFVLAEHIIDRTQILVISVDLLYVSSHISYRLSQSAISKLVFRARMWRQVLPK